MFSVFLTIVVLINSVRVDSLPNPMPKIENVSVIYGSEADTLRLDCPEFSTAPKIITKDIRGKVVNATTGAAVAGAKLVEAKTKNVTRTDADGNFSITITDGSFIVISAQGYLSKKLKPYGNNYYKIELEDDPTEEF